MLALAPSPAGFSATDFRAKVQSMTGQSDGDYTPRQAAYDLKKLRAKDLITKLGRSRRYQLSPPSMRAITALLVLREHVIGPLLAGARTHRTPPSRQRGRLSTSTTNSFDSTCSPSFRSSVSQHRQPDCRSIGASA